VHVLQNRTGADSRSAYEQTIIERAKSILKPFFLRRLKSEVGDRRSTRDTLAGL